MLFVRAYPRESQEMVFDAHDRAFAFFKGACRRGIYDNMKTAVETIFVGKERAYNRRFLQMCGHYLVDPVACTPGIGLGEGPGREPGRPGARAVLHAAAAGEELRRAERPGCSINAWPTPRPIPIPSSARPHRLAGLRGGAGEPGALRRGPFDGFHAVPASVSKTCLVRFDNNKYSVIASAIGRPVEVRAYAERIELRQGRPDRRSTIPARSVAMRASSTPGTTFRCWRASPARCRNGAPFKDWVLPAALDRVRRKLAGSR